MMSNTLPDLETQILDALGRATRRVSMLDIITYAHQHPVENAQPDDYREAMFHLVELGCIRAHSDLTYDLPSDAAVRAGDGADAHPSR